MIGKLDFCENDGFKYLEFTYQYFSNRFNLDNVFDIKEPQNWVEIYWQIARKMQSGS